MLTLGAILALKKTNLESLLLRLTIEDFRDNYNTKDALGRISVIIVSVNSIRIFRKRI